MQTLISETIQDILSLMVGEYFRYSVALVAIIGVLGLIYRLTGKAR